MSEIYEVRSDIPIPDRGRTSGLSATIRKMQYGDSIVIPAGQHLSVHTCARSVGARELPGAWRHHNADADLIDGGGH